MFDSLFFSAIIVVFVVATVIQLLFHLFVFTKLVFYKKQASTPVANFGVSLIVCAWNELENLRNLIPLLDAQEYPNFEVIIVDDRSTDGSYEFLLLELSPYKNVRFIRIENTPNHITAKKYALTLGIKAAKKEVILLTDADCVPSSGHWLLEMANAMTPEKDIVLGFSPYNASENFLNNAIRYETFFTAIQYFSLALVGIPFMGVGRNLMYRRKLFLDNKGFFKHQHILGGDDDLFINEVSNATNVAVCLQPEAQTFSVPKTSWNEWYTQKRRHLAVGKKYKMGRKLVLGLLSLSHILHWLLAIVLIPWLLIQGDFFTNQAAILVLGIFMLRFVAVWLVSALCNKKLHQTIGWLRIPFFDFIFTFYYLIMGGITLFSRKRISLWR